MSPATLVLVLASTASVAHAGPLTVEAGGGVLVLDTADARGGAASEGAFAVGARVQPDARLPVALHVAIVFGVRDVEAGMRLLGVVTPVLATGRVRVELGPAIASVRGADSELGDALVPRGIGAALDLRATVTLGSRVSLAIGVLPTWIFASDAVAPEARLRAAVSAVATVDIAL
jgi:hypothetical protein